MSPLRINTLREVADLAVSGRLGAMRALREFLGSFAGMSAVERQTAIDAEPVLTGDDVTDAYLAASAEMLAMRLGLHTPAWVRGPRRCLGKPWYAGGMESLKPILLVESPSAFRIRNLFVSANALDRPGLQLAMNEFQGAAR